MRLIDADALIDTMAIIAKKFARSDAQKALMGRVMYIIEHKAENVVRCKDCIYWQHEEDVDFVCNRHHGYRTSMDYCSYGERKEE